ncbi:ATP-dependent zinc metalloprotease FtsH [Gossypium australe]|uniref:ATP-dependent zinc metalloprotease FtsH n=1 Tax=Gossypium australe TaxID=47621 RepID=A0A5B6VBH2_9ROSI|nr:ATP-dependent zinc metalloprotease FtsH [Gossypium australe]
MSARRGARGCSRGHGSVRVESLASGHMFNVEIGEASASHMAEMGPNDRAAGEEALSQAMLRILERVAGPNNGTGNRGAIPERLRSNGADVFKGIASVAPNVVEYWMEATKRIMDDLDYTADQKLKGAVSLLWEEAYQWWLTYVGASYVDARRKEFLNLTQGNKSVAEYEAEFLCLSRYARAIVATNSECCVRFEDGLSDSLRVLIAPERGRVFSELVEKAKIAEEVERTERLNREKEKGRNKRKAESSGVGQRPRAKARVNGPVRAGHPTANSGIPPCTDCGRGHTDECWRRTGACLGCGSMTHRIKDCPRRLVQVQVVGQANVQPPRGGQQLPRAEGRLRAARQPAFIYAAHRHEDENAPDVITGMFLIHELPYTTLIDIGSTHSYVACNKITSLGDMFEITANRMTMLSPLGQSVEVNKLYRDVPLVVQGVTFLADLMELPFSEFDLILGMDWLVKR